jgi:hypothetical protein
MCLFSYCSGKKSQQEKLERKDEIQYFAVGKVKKVVDQGFLQGFPFVTFEYTVAETKIVKQQALPPQYKKNILT